MNKNVGGLSQFNADLAKTNAAVQSAKSGRGMYAQSGATHGDSLSSEAGFTDSSLMSTQFEQMNVGSTAGISALKGPNTALLGPSTRPSAVMSNNGMIQPQQQYVTNDASWLQQQQHQQQHQQQMLHMQQMQMNQMNQQGAAAATILQKQQQFLGSQTQALAQKQMQQQQMHALQAQQLQMQQMQMQMHMQQMQMQAQAAQVRAQAQVQDESESVLSILRQQQSEEDLQSDLEANLNLLGGDAAEMGTNGNMGLGFTPDAIYRLQNGENEKWRNSKFIRFVDRLNKGEIKFEGNDVVDVDPSAVLADAVSREFEAVVGDEDLTEGWEARFANGEVNPYARNEDGSYTDPIGDMFGDTINEAFATEDYVAMERDFGDYLDALKFKEPAYVYTSTPSEARAAAELTDESSSVTGESAMLRGIEHFEAGRITAAIACFELATYEDAQNSEAWRWLGQSWAQNEEDGQAIAALEKSVAADPYNLNSLLMLGVSHTNNLDGARALSHLKTWLANHPDYALLDLDLTGEEGVTEVDTTNGGISMGTFDSADHEEVVKLFRKAAEIAPHDADVWTVLGVLYNLSSDFEHAVQAFQEATQLRSEDPELWNKLGATLANSNRGSEAVSAYERALTYRPSYIRARANLGIAHYNEGQFWEGARAFLTCLEENSSPSHLWSFLRMSLSYVGRDDLAELAKEKNVELLRPHINF